MKCTLCCQTKKKKKVKCFYLPLDHLLPLFNKLLRCQKGYLNSVLHSFFTKTFYRLESVATAQTLLQHTLPREAQWGSDMDQLVKVVRWYLLPLDHSKRAPWTPGLSLWTMSVTIREEESHWWSKLVTQDVQECSGMFRMFWMSRLSTWCWPTAATLDLFVWSDKRYLKLVQKKHPPLDSKFWWWLILRQHWKKLVPAQINDKTKKRWGILTFCL